MFKFYLFVLILSVLSRNYGKIILSQKVSCKLESIGNVDWYYLYKLPRGFGPNTNSSGLRYLYTSSATVDKGWQLSSNLLNETGSTPGLTMHDDVLKSESVLLVGYNDENPNGQVDFANGHTKGVLATDGHTGFWLIHSVPKYPTIPAYSYPTTGQHYGQSFLCISINSTQIDAIGEQLVYNEPNIYYSRIPTKLQGQFPNVEKAIKKEWITSGPFYNELELVSANGIKFKSFAKGSKFNKELYEDWVAPVLNTDLYVETWRNGPGVLPSNCSLLHKVYNVQNIALHSVDFEFKSTHDHSKWAIGTNWICVGDINRAAHQLVRGGGTVCQENSQVTSLYKSVVESFQTC